MNSEQLRELYEGARDRLHEANRAIQEAGEDADLDELQRELTEAADEAERHRVNLEERERVEQILARNPETAQAATPSPARVVSEPSTYRERGEHSFFTDAFRFKANADPEARERLERHGREVLDAGVQLRDVGTGAFAGLTIPQFMVDLVAPLARAGRPFANSVRHLPLSASGMVISISKVTTGSAVAAQAAENDAVQETNIDDTKLDVDIRTYAGQQDVSRQALERSEIVEQLVYADLVSDYHTKLDDAALNGAGTSGTHKGIRSASGLIAVTYTDASPTVAEFISKLADAIQQINSQRFLPATVIWMHPRRWGWLTAASDSTGRPLVVPKAPMNPVGVGQAAEYGQVVGELMGLPVITDANLPTNLGGGTNQDPVLVGRADENLLWEEGDGMPRQLRFEETDGGNLTVKLVVYGYSAFTAERYPKANAAIDGTGLIAPTF